MDDATLTGITGGIKRAIFIYCFHSSVSAGWRLLTAAYKIKQQKKRLVGFTVHKAGRRLSWRSRGARHQRESRERRPLHLVLLVPLGGRNVGSSPRVWDSEGSGRPRAATLQRIRSAWRGGHASPARNAKRRRRRVTLRHFFSHPLSDSPQTLPAKVHRLNIGRRRLFRSTD